MADRPANGNTVARSTPHNDARTRTEEGHEQKDHTLERSFDPRDLEIQRLRKECDGLRAREQMARAEAEELHKRLTLLSQASKRFASSMRSGTSDRQRYRRRLATQYAVSRALEHSRNLGEGAAEILRIIGENLGWEVGVLWKMGGNVLCCETVWQSQTVSPDTFEEACRRVSFARGEGLPGQVWVKSEPVWVEDILAKGDPLAEAVAEKGLRGALAFPVRDGRLAGVFEFFSSELLTPDEDLLRTVSLVGRQIGQFVERRRAEAERDRSLTQEREARRELSGILESISDAFFAVDREWRFTYVNRRAEELWSKSREDLLGKSLWEEFPQADDSVQYREIRRAMKERTTTGFEAISPKMDVWVAGSAYPSADGGVSVYFSDVSERKRVEEALRDSEERFRAIVSQATAGICRTDLGGRLEFVNNKMCELLGYPEAELVGKSIRELTHPDDLQENIGLFRRLATDGKPFLLEKRLLRKDGSTIWANVSVSAIRDAAGKPRSAGAVVLDVTERKRAEEALKESEERLQRAIAIETVGVIFLKASGEITEANDAFLRMSGYSNEDLAEGLLRWDVMTPPEWMPRSLEAVEELETTGRTTPYEKEYIRKDGSRWWGLFAATRLGEEEDVEFIIDVTGRKRTEAERERLIAHELTARAQAEERRRLSRELHDRVAHDIALVHQSLELHEVLKSKNPEKAAAKMQLARRIVKEALESTRDLSMELREQEVRRGLEAALANLLRDLVPPTVESSLSVEGDETLVPPEIRNQVFLVLREAIRNAVTHSGAGRIAVELDIGRERVAGSVEDNGSGFDPDAIRSAGSGGLRAMEERAMLLGGTLDLSSAPESGTTVKVSIPLGDA